MTDDPSVPILWRMLDDAKQLSSFADDPVLEGRTGFLVAYLHDILRLKDPFNSIEHIVEFE
jgi:hypothetical protein